MSDKESTYVQVMRAPDFLGRSPGQETSDALTP
jgi:hypothetical protein